jgi:hypothetical protein
MTVLVKRYDKVERIKNDLIECLYKTGWTLEFVKEYMIANPIYHSKLFQQSIRATKAQIREAIIYIKYEEVIRKENELKRIEKEKENEKQRIIQQEENERIQIMLMIEHHEKQRKIIEQTRYSTTYNKIEI